MVTHFPECCETCSDVILAKKYIQLERLTYILLDELDRQETFWRHERDKKE